MGFVISYVFLSFLSLKWITIFKGAKVGSHLIIIYYLNYAGYFALRPIEVMCFNTNFSQQFLEGQVKSKDLVLHLDKLKHHAVESNGIRGSR